MIDENLTASYIHKQSKRNEYVEKFREYKAAYRKKWHKYKSNCSEPKYLEDVRSFIDDMKPFNKLLKDNKLDKNEYLKILNERKNKTIY